MLKFISGFLGGSREHWAAMVLYVSAPKNSEIGKVIDKKWFIRIELLWGLQAGWRESVDPSGLEFYNQRKRGDRWKKTFFLLLE